MNLTRDMVISAVDAGLALTDPEQELLHVFRKHNQGLTILRAILENISTGNIVLSSPKPPVPPPGIETPAHDPEEVKPGGTNPDDD